MTMNLRPYRKVLASGLALCALIAAFPAQAHGASEAPTAAIDPALLTKAEVAAAVLVPAGSTEKMMEPLFDTLGKQMTSSMLNIPMKSIARIAGIEPDEAAALGEGTVQELMAIMDPAFDQRMAAMMTAMGREMGPLMTQFEPMMREAMARSFARNYSSAELDEINLFLASPTGARFGAGFMALAADPEYLKAMEVMMPRLMEAMPAVMEKVMAEVRGIAPMRSYEDLTEAEKQRIAALVGKKD